MRIYKTGNTMHVIIKVLAVVMLLTTYYLPLTTSGLYAAFKDPGFGARPLGLGGAFCAVADDVNAALYNPAGIYISTQYKIGMMYAQLYSGLEDVNLGLQDVAFIIPTENSGNFGFTWTRFADASDYFEDAMIFTYANKYGIKPVPEFYAGINLKYLGHTYKLDDRTRPDPVFANGNSKGGVTADLGLWVPTDSSEEKETAIGFTFKNLIQTDIGLKTEDKVPSELRTGFKHSVTQLGSMHNFLVAADLSYRNEENAKDQNRVNLHIGSEAWFFNELLGVRLGGNANEFGGGFSIKKIVSGLELQLDYSLLIPLTIQGSSGSHRMSLSCGF